MPMTTKEMTMEEYKKGFKISNDYPIKETTISKSGKWIEITQKTEDYDSSITRIGQERILFDMEEAMPKEEYVKLINEIKERLNENLYINAKSKIEECVNNSKDFKGLYRALVIDTMDGLHSLYIPDNSEGGFDFMYAPLSMLDKMLGYGELDKILDSLDLYL